MKKYSIELYKESHNKLKEKYPFRKDHDLINVLVRDINNNVIKIDSADKMFQEANRKEIYGQKARIEIKIDANTYNFLRALMAETKCSNFCRFLNLLIEKYIL